VQSLADWYRLCERQNVKYLHRKYVGSCTGNLPLERRIVLTEVIDENPFHLIGAFPGPVSCRPLSNE